MMNKVQFDQIGGDWIDPPILMPASLPLELSGEAVRSRLITSADAPGEEVVLRPDLTLAVASEFLKSAPDTPVSYRYFGKAFRQPVLPGEPLEFYQTGFECFGHEDRAERDLTVLSVICETVAEAGLKDVRLMLGNISIFTDFVKSLQLSSFWTENLIRAFRRNEGIRRLLTETDIAPRSALAATLSELPPQRAEELLDEVLDMSGGQVIAGRTREDILARLQLRASAADEGPLDSRARRLLGELMGISGSADQVLNALRHLAQSSGLKLDDTLDAISAFHNELSARSMPFWKDAQISIQFGRRFDYYDGLVFELVHNSLNTRRPVAAGGRYDGLIGLLSKGQSSMPAIGGVVRPDRIAQAQAAEGRMV